MTEWTSTTIGNLHDSGHAQLQTGPFGTQLHSYDYLADGVPVVPTEAIRERAIDISSLPRISHEKSVELSRHSLFAGDLLFARRGIRAAGRVGLIREREHGYICGTGAIRLRLVPGSPVSSEYLSHVLADPTSVKWFKDHAVGATMPNLNEGIIRAFPFSFPSLSTQRRIASVLSAYDDLIENNTRRIGVLEEMARGLHRECSAPFAISTREGWTPSSLGDLVSLSKSTVSPNMEPDTEFDLFSFEACDLGRLPIATMGAKIQSNKFRVSPGVVLLPKLNPHIPRVWLPFLEGDRPKICSTEFLVLLPREGIPRSWIYATLESSPFTAELAQRADGTSNSHKRLKPDDVLKRPVLVPPSETLQRFDMQASLLYEQCHVLRRRNHALRAARDLLLPKLLSGELSVDRIPDPAAVAP